MAKKYSASGENRGLSVDSKSPLSDTENLALRILFVPASCRITDRLRYGTVTRCYRRGAVERSLSHGFQARHSGNYLGRHTQLVCRIPDSENFETGLGLQYRNYRSKVRPAEKNGHRKWRNCLPGKESVYSFSKD